MRSHTADTRGRHEQPAGVPKRRLIPLRGKLSGQLRQMASQLDGQQAMFGVSRSFAGAVFPLAEPASSREVPNGPRVVDEEGLRR